MPIDRYTKTVLTIIAGCLLWLCAAGPARPLLAQQTPMSMSSFRDSVQPVVIVGSGWMDAQGRVSVNFTQQNGSQRTDPTLVVQLPYSAARPLPVALPYSATHPLPAELFYSPTRPMPVEIAGIKRTGDWEPIRTHVESAGVRKTPGDSR